MIIKYDEELDILSIRDENKKIKSSLRVGPHILDFSFDGKVVGVEILNASETLGESLNLDEGAFKDVEKASIRNIIKPDVLLVVLTLIIRKKEYVPILNIPLKHRIEHNNMASLKLV